MSRASGASAGVVEPLRRRIALAGAGATVALAGLWPSLLVHAAAAGTINTFAGGNPTGDGGAPTSAALNVPGQVAVDGSGNLYIADSQDNRIRKVTPGADGVIARVNTTGAYTDTDDMITTVAGNGTPGYAGDGAAATAAELNAPQGVAIDPNGNLWIADQGNGRVRFVCLQSSACSLPSGATLPSNDITTVAGTGARSASGDGGSATAAAIAQPWAIAFDAAGDAFIADFYMSGIRFICVQATCTNANWYGTVSQGNITTVAGTNAGFSESDSGDGGPAIQAGISGPQGLAVDSGGNLYVAEKSGQRIRKVTASTGIISTLTTGPPNIPTGQAFEPTQIQMAGSGGALDISDLGLDDIEQYSFTTGTFAIVAGVLNSPGYSGDGGPANAAKLNLPDGVVLTGAGETFVSDSGNLRVRKVTTSGLITTAVGNGTTIAIGDGGPATQAGLSDPWDVATDSAGDVFIADGNDNRVRFVCKKAAGCTLAGATISLGTITTVAGNGSAGDTGNGGSATGAGLNYPDGVAVDSFGNVFISEYNGHQVRFVCMQSTACSLPSGAGGPSVAAGSIATVAGAGTGSDGGPASQAAVIPQGLAVDSSGNLYIADVGHQKVRFVCLQAGACALPGGAGVPTVSSGNIATIAGTGTQGFAGDGGFATTAQLSCPEGIALDAESNMYIADTCNNAVRYVCLQSTICGSPFGVVATGTITTVAGRGPTNGGFSGDGGRATAAMLSYPDSVRVDRMGNLHVTDGGNQRIRVVCMLSTCPEYLSSSGIAQGVITSLAGNGTAGLSGDGALADGAEMNGARGIALDGANNLFITDENNNRVRAVTSPVTLQPYPSPLYPSFAPQSLSTSSAPQMVTLTNPTSSSISVSSVGISGSNGGDFGVVSGSDHCSGTSVPAGGSCTVQLVFRPGASTTANRSATLTFTDSGGPTTTQTAGLVGTVSVGAFTLTPSPVAVAASLAPGTTTTVTATAKDSGGNALGGATMDLAFTPTTGGGSAAVGGTTLTATSAAFVANSSGQVAISYTTPATLPTGGEDIIVAQNAQSSPTVTAQDKYVFTKVTGYKWSRSPIASTGSLAAGSSVKLTLTAKNASGGIVAGTKVYLSFTQAPGGGSARVGTTPLTATPEAFTTDSKGHIVITYTTPSSPPSSGTDTISAEDATTNPSVTARDGYTY